MQKRKAKYLTMCGGGLLPEHAKYNRRACSFCRRYMRTAPPLVDKLVYNQQRKTFTCEYFVTNGNHY